MSSDVIAIVIAVVIVGVFIAIAIAKRPKAVKMSKDAQARRAADAAERGWRVDASGTDDEPVVVYSGTTDFITWRCEMRARYVAGQHVDDAPRQHAHTRWSTDAARLGQGLLIITSASAPEQLIPPNLPEAMLARLAPAMEVLGVEPRDAALVASAAVVEDAALQAHYRLRATDPAVMRSFLDGGARAALLDAAPWLAGSSPHSLMVATLGSRGLAIVVSGFVDDPDLVARIADVGSRLAGARGV